MHADAMTADSLLQQARRCSARVGRAAAKASLPPSQVQLDIERQRAQLRGLDGDLLRLEQELSLKLERCALLRAERNEALLCFMYDIHPLRKC